MRKNATRVVYVRKLVNQAFDKIWDYPLTVVEAPMGYGKTTALKMYLKDRHTEVLWQTLLDNSATVFWNGFCRLLKNVNPAAATSLAELGVPQNSVFLEEAIRIMEDIEFPLNTLFVIDDYHLLFNDNIDRFLELLVRAELPNLHIVIISRSIFGENTAELVLKGYCQVIGRAYFELSRDEIVEYGSVYGIKLASEDIDFLLCYTEGWISAIYLCLLGFLQDGRIERQITLYELIEKVVYQRISPKSQEFLLAICILNSFSLEQAEYMWPKGNAETLLGKLVSENAFIRYDQSNKTYYLHNIFASYLRRIFDRQTFQQKQAVWARAGNWHVKNRECMDALEYFYKAVNFAELLTAIELDIGHSIQNEHKERLIRYFSDCPEQIKREHIQACLIYAINLFSFNEMELFIKQCEEIRQYITMLPKDKEQEKNQLAGELELLYSFTKYNHIPEMSEHIHRADSLMNAPADFIDRNGSWTFGSPSILYMFYRESGQLKETVDEMKMAIKHYVRVTDGHGCGAESVMQAEWYYHIGDFENAQIAAHTALYSARSQKQTAIVLCALFLQLRLALVQGDLEYIVNSLQQTRAEIKQQGLYSYLHTWDMCEGFIYSYLKQEKKIPAWIIKGDVEEQVLSFPSYAFFNIIWGKVLLMDGDYLKLIGLKEMFINITSVFPNLLGQIYTYIFESASEYKLGRHQDAQATLKKALDIAIADQLIMPFVENGEYLMDIIAELQPDAFYQNFISKIQEILPSIEKKREIMLTKLSNGDAKLSLTPREQEIVELVVAGLSNRAIGETLYIAEITVKKALQHIYTKLGTNNRVTLTKMIIAHKNY